MIDIDTLPHEEKSHEVRRAHRLNLRAKPIQRVTMDARQQRPIAEFQFGPTALGLAQPVAPGVCADALARRGPGPFQILYRTTSMDAAAKWMSGHGVPPPARGIRNTGEQAMLVAPEHACGVYIGFVGPA